jgi:hypothetical protein
MYILMNDPAVKKEVRVEEKKYILFKEILLHVKKAGLSACDTVHQHKFRHAVQAATDRLACLRAIVKSRPQNIDSLSGGWNPAGSTRHGGH